MIGPGPGLGPMIGPGSGLGPMIGPGVGSLIGNGFLIPVIGDGNLIGGLGDVIGPGLGKVTGNFGFTVPIPFTGRIDLTGKGFLSFG